MAAPNVVPFPKPPARGRKPAQRAQADPQARLKRKIDQTDRVLNRLEERVAGLDALIASVTKELKARRERMLARIEKIESRTISEMQQHRIKQLIGNLVTLATRPNAPRLIVDNEKLIPDKYMRQPKTPPKEPDKVLIKAILALADREEATEADIQAAAEIQGVHLAQTYTLTRTR